jgi:hypothetical protein
MGWVMGDILAGESDGAAGHRFQTDNQLEQRTLAGTVGTDDGQNLAIISPHGYPVNSGKAAIVLRDLS